MIVAQERNTIWSIQYLRAAAAIAVVVHHQLQGRGWIFRVGEHGVDMFFVISGFIMFALTDSRNITPVSFALDRVARIVPSYWLATVAAFILACTGIEFYGSSHDITFLALSILFIPARNEIGVIMPTLYLGWTLIYEVFFYGVFTTVLFFQNFRVLVMSFVLSMLIMSGIAFKPEGPILTTYTSILLLEFLSGVMLGKLFGMKLTRMRKEFQICGSLMIAAALTSAGTFSFNLYFGALSVLLVSGCLILERDGKIPHIEWLKKLGDASFAIYLYQQFAFELVRFSSILSNYLLKRDVDASLLQIMNIIAAVLLGILLLRYVESPLTKTVRNRLRILFGESSRLGPPVTNIDPYK